MSIAIIIVHYNTPEITARLIASLLGDTSSIHREVIVVDNQSTEENYAALRQHIHNPQSHSGLHWVRPIKNNGFAAGVNEGLRKARDLTVDWYVLLNSDVSIGSGFFEELVMSLRGCEGNIVGIPLRESSSVIYGGLVRWFSAHTAPAREISETTSSRYYPSGGALAIHRDADAKIGDWDERYFLYYEDVAYAFAARRMGISVQAVTKPIVEHIGGLSTRALGTERLWYLHYRNSLMFQTQYAPWWAQSTVPFWSIALLVWHWIRRDRAIVRGILDFWKGAPS